MPNAADIKSRNTTYNVDPNDIDVITDPNHPLYDPRADANRYPLTEERIVQAYHMGIRDAVKARRNTSSGRLECVAGRRRILTLRAANVRLAAEGKPTRTIKVEQVLFDDRQCIAEMIIENTREEEDNYSRAVKMRAALAAGYTEADLCMMFQVGQQTIRNCLSVLELPPEGQQLAQQGKLPSGVIAQLSGKSAQEKRELLTQALAEGGGEIRGKRGLAAVGLKTMLGKRPIQAILARADLHPAARSALESVMNGAEFNVSAITVGG